MVKFNVSVVVASISSCSVVNEFPCDQYLVTFSPSNSAVILALLSAVKVNVALAPRVLFNVTLLGFISPLFGLKLSTISGK